MRSFFLWLGILFFLLSCLFVAFLPTLASSNWGREQIIRWINTSIPGKVEIGALHLNWGKGQSIEQLILKDPQQEIVLAIEKFSTEATLWQLLSQSTHLGFTQIQELNATIKTDNQGISNLQRALQKDSFTASQILPSSTMILSHVQATGYLFSDDHPFSLQVQGNTQKDSLEGSFQAELALPGFTSSDWETLKTDTEHYLTLTKSQQAKISAHVAHFPVDLLDRFISLKYPHLNGFLHSLLGDQLNLTLDKESHAEGLAFNWTILAPFMQGDIKWEIKNGIITLLEPAIFHFNLGPKDIHPLTPHVMFLEFSRLQMTLPALSLPLDFLEKGQGDPSQLAFRMEASLPPTWLKSDSLDQPVRLTLTMAMDAPLGDKTIHMQLNGEGQFKDQEPFAIHFESTFNKPNESDIWNANGEMNAWQKMGLQATLHVQRLSPLAIKTFLFLNQEKQQLLDTLFGDAIEIKANCKLNDLNGPVDIALTGVRGALEMDGFLSQEVLTLKAPLTYSTLHPFSLFDQLSSALHVPLFRSFVATEQPIHLTIEPSLFSCPLFPFNMKQIKIGRGRIDMGKIIVRQEGDLQFIFNLIHSLSENQLTAWLTPLYFQVDQGQFQLERFDMLIANAYPLAAWGNINLATQQGNFIIGLPARSLQEIFGIGGLKDSYLLQIPLSYNGKMNIDQNQLLQRIGLLVAKMKGGKKGQLISDLLDVAIFNQEAEPPSPTTQPFPWASSLPPREELSPPPDDPEIPDTEQEKTQKKKKRKKHKEKGKKDVFGHLEQEISHAINDLLK